MAGLVVSWEAVDVWLSSWRVEDVAEVGVVGSGRARAVAWE